MGPAAKCMTPPKRFPMRGTPTAEKGPNNPL